MTCPQCIGIERFFNAKQAARDLKHYHKNGPDKVTKILIEAIRGIGAQDSTLLDIGGGVGVIQNELLNSGVKEVLSVEASPAYAETAEKEAIRQGNSDRIRRLSGDFIDLQGAVSESDIVTLNRVVCCYPDADSLVRKSAGLASRIYGVVIPRDFWVAKSLATIGNLYHQLRGIPFRVYIHSTRLIDGMIREMGFKQVFLQKTLLWQITVYNR